jgi:hypothetical protein
MWKGAISRITNGGRYLKGRLLAQTIVFDLEPVRNNILSIESVLEMLKAKSLYYYDIDLR